MGVAMQRGDSLPARSSRRASSQSPSNAGCSSRICRGSELEGCDIDAPPDDMMMFPISAVVGPDVTYNRVRLQRSLAHLLAFFWRTQWPAVIFFCSPGTRAQEAAIFRGKKRRESKRERDQRGRRSTVGVERTLISRAVPITDEHTTHSRLFTAMDGAHTHCLVQEGRPTVSMQCGISPSNLRAGACAPCVGART